MFVVFRMKFFSLNITQYTSQSDSASKEEILRGWREVIVGGGEGIVGKGEGTVGEGE